MDNTNIYLKSPTYKVVDIVTKTKAMGWKDVKVGDVIYFEFDPYIKYCDDGKFMYVYNKSQESSFNVRNTHFHYMIEHFKLEEVIC